MDRTTHVESLELRRHLSVSAATLAFPLTAGSHWTTSDDDGTTDSIAVVGSSSFDGHTATKISDNTQSPGSGPSLSTIYAGFDGSKNFVSYGAVVMSSDDTADPPTSNTTTETFEPALIEYPATMVAGHTYSSSATLDGVSVDTPGDTTTASVSVVSTVRLVSDTLQKITVPAGTFMCYELDETSTYSNAKNTSETSETEWIAPGVYPVKTVDTSDGGNDTTVLTSNNAKKTPTQLAIDGQPTDGAVGAALTPAIVVDVEDKDGGIVTTDTSTVTLSIIKGPTDAVLTGGSAAAVNGVATFSGLKFNKAGTYTLRASDGSLAGATSLTFVIKTTGAAKLAFGVEPPSANTDTKLAPAATVEVDNDDGTLNTADTSSVTLAVESGPVGGVLVGTTTVTAVKGVATFADLSLDIPGTYTLKATDGDLDSAVSTSFTIISKAKASKLAFSVQPTNTVAGKAIASVRVAVEYPGGAIVQNDTSTVTLALAGGPGTLGGTLTAKAVNGVATFTSLMLTKAGVYTLKATDGALTLATSNAFTITAAAAAKLAFAATPPTTVAGKPITPGVAVIVQDAFGNTVTGDTSKISVALAAGSGTLAGTTTVTAKAGVATFSTLSLAKAGAYALKASDGTLPVVKTGTFTVTPAAATKLVLATSLPATTVAGKVFSPATVVDLEDAFGNIVTTDTSKVTLAVATGGGAFTGTATVAAKAGVATFSNLVLTESGAHTFKATDGALTAATSKSFTITAAAASKVVFAAALPTTVTAGKAIAPAVVADVEDQYGNVVTGDASKVTVSVLTGPAAATLGGTVYAFAKAGIVTFANLLLTKAGAYTLQAVDGSLAAAKSTAIQVQAGAAAKLGFVQPPKSGKANTTLTPAVTVAVEDAFGNVVTADKSKISIAIATGPGGAVLAGTTSVAAGSGVAAFNALELNKTGAYTLKVIDGVLTPATSSSFTIS